MGYTHCSDKSRLQVSLRFLFTAFSTVTFAILLIRYAIDQQSFEEYGYCLAEQSIVAHSNWDESFAIVFSLNNGVSVEARRHLLSEGYQSRELRKVKFSLKFKGKNNFKFYQTDMPFVSKVLKRELEVGFDMSSIKIIEADISGIFR
jgi:hypothetical protein